MFTKGGRIMQRGSELCKESESVYLLALG